jgi:hypothetical protein
MRGDLEKQLPELQLALRRRAPCPHPSRRLHPTRLCSRRPHLRKLHPRRPHVEDAGQLRRFCRAGRGRHQRPRLATMRGLSTARRSMASWWSSTLVTLPLLLPTPNESQTSQDVFDRSFAAGCSTRRRARPR